ncbi:precorrin-2 C(20)-methyltransferase [Pseudovibrio sp. Tun.PSC04-5.I4]|uniref:precorrin-2 C(20)-methyltransferase n=1 Tax=Pseudovibrio sp. Tun.PSC04-5.I4 TaxID=1798213 RepID=UPI000888BFC4|nr:precorrin-2 C(20)-methyltransferase [Pseudovibrio sp. Tun.PSC04-5.I4]SDR21771.1 precorrin-2/cobalt-factor-2 C20-methyltransferase [Pseudovibrio sp. Tun.PSC04-5.I4]
MTGTLYGVGLGPGDPELLTLKAHRLICSAKTIAYPAAIGVPSFARHIASQYIAEGTIEIPIEMPMKVERFPAKEIYDQAAATIAAKLESGEDVVVLCEGDPFLYGSFMYLYERLQGDFPCEVVPGVSSINACAAALGRPLAARNDVLTIIPGPSDNDKLTRMIEQTDAFVIMKVGRHLPRVKALLEELGLLGAAGYVERATLPEMVVTRLADYPNETAPYFSMIIVYKGEEAWTLPRQS